MTTFNKSAPNRQIVLVIQPTSVKLNFNSGATKKEICTFDLNKMDLSKFDSLGFSLRKTKYSDVIFLRVELINAFQEKSEIYIKDLQSRWRDYRINFADFKNITDWTKISSLSFIIEEWNMTGERGVIYIDNVKVIKERG